MMAMIVVCKSSVGCRELRRPAGSGYLSAASLSIKLNSSIETKRRQLLLPPPLRLGIEI